jgi:hypothetical protein
MAGMVGVIHRLAQSIAQGYGSDTAYYAALRATALLTTMLWVLALALLYGPSSPPDATAGAPACVPVDALWLPMCRE